MRASHVLELINQRDQLRKERDRYRIESYVHRAFAGILFASSLTVLVIGGDIGTPLAIVSWMAMAALFTSGLVWSAKRGDAAMGIGETQGRDFPAAPSHSTPLSEAHSEGPKDPLRSA